MRTLNIASSEGVNGEQSPGKLTSASRPINIASVRATSLRTSGLRAASSRGVFDAQKGNKSAMSALTTETRMDVNYLSCLSSSVSMASTSHLSYTDSQEPGEDSQLNAFAMVDNLVNLNASLIWQKPESSRAAEQSCMKGPQSSKGFQSLARNADIKNLQDKMGIYNWIDSQPNEIGDLEQVSDTSKGQKMQLEACMPTESRKVWQGMVSGANDTSNAVVMAEEANLVKQRNMERNLCPFISAEEAEGNHAKEGSAYFERHPFSSMHRLEVSVVVSNKLHDTDASDDKGEAEITDIGANTQIALEAIDIMRCGILLNNEIAQHNKKATSALFDIGNDTQNAIDAIDIMRHGIETDTVLPKVKATSSDVGNDTQTAIDAIDIMRHGIETDRFLSKVERREEIERGLRVQNSRGNVKEHISGDDFDAKRKLSPVPKGLLSKLPTDEKAVGKKVSSRGLSKPLKSQKDALFNPAGPIYNSNKRFLLDFTSAMVPRRKRSRLCAPRSTLNENIQLLGWQKYDFHLHKPLTKADEQAQPDKPTKLGSRKRGQWPKRDSNSPEVTVLTESTNGELVRQTKKDILTKSHCYTSLEQSRKKRKCESKYIFVLFSHSLSEAIIKQQKKMLTKLGGHAATSAAKATHFVADSFVRSRNMLEIMAAGKMVITTMWLEGCAQAEYFVDENSYILEDVQKEKQWGFRMHSSLAASRRKPLFKDMKVVVSPTTTPDFEAIKAMIESAGGQALQKLSSSSHSKADGIFVVGSEKDYDFCVEFLKKGCKVYSTELILHGVVTQNLDLSRHRLFEDYKQ